MTLVRFNPGSAQRRFFNHFDGLVKDIFNDDFFTPFFAPPTRSPQANFIETADNYRLELAFPGLSKEDIEVKVDKDILSIKATKEYKAVEGEKVLHNGFGKYHYERSFRLPKTVDASLINGQFENGVLVVVLNKKEEEKEQASRLIEIS